MRSRLFGRMTDGRAVQAFSLRGSIGLGATIAQYGARITELLAPVAGARNVTLGFDRLEPHLSDNRRLGSVAGCDTNRAGGARFTLDERKRQLQASDGCPTPPGEPGGFAYRALRAKPNGDTLRLTLHSPDGDQGFSGRLDVAPENRPLANSRQRCDPRMRRGEGQRLQRAGRQPPLTMECEAWRSSRLCAAI